MQEPAPSGDHLNDEINRVNSPQQWRPPQGTKTRIAAWIIIMLFVGSTIAMTAILIWTMIRSGAAS